MLLLNKGAQSKKEAKEMKILITGGTGFVGTQLVYTILEKTNHNIVLLVRSLDAVKHIQDFINQNDQNNQNNQNCKMKNRIDFFQCDLLDIKSIPPIAISGIDAVVNLQGEPIASSRWTKKKKESIYNSRVTATKNLIESIKIHSSKKLNVFISTSAIGYYGSFLNTSSNSSTLIDETSSPGNDFLAKVCIDWEKTLDELQSTYVERKVILRLGIVMDLSGGMLFQLIDMFKKNLGAYFGNGENYISWIARVDLINIILLMLDNKSFSNSSSNLNGIFNIVTPNPITAKDLSIKISKFLNGKICLKLPAIIIKILLGESSILILSNQKISAKRLSEINYKYILPTIDSLINKVPIL